MSDALIVVDLGNSSVAAAHGPAPTRAVLARAARSRPALEPLVAGAPSGDPLAADGALAAALGALAQRSRLSGAGAAQVWGSSVARPARAAQLADLVRAAGLPELRLNAPSGLALALRCPETCGFDRQYAARAALERSLAELETGALVVDVGTAMTVDAVVARSDARGAAALAALGLGPPLAAQAGVFLGGAIAPGPRLLASALARGGARLFEVDGLQDDVPALGRDSAAALRSGIVHGLAGAAAELVRRVGRDAALDDAPIWVTGGAAPLVFGTLRAAFGARARPAPGLVLEGLAYVAHDAQAAERPDLERQGPDHPGPDHPGPNHPDPNHPDPDRPELEGPHDARAEQHR
ncbi:MAG: type III pantothenate kinase [Planctomycetota bacterium]